MCRVRFVWVFLLVATLCGAAPQRTLLLEIPDVPKAEQTRGGLFYYGGYDFDRIIRVVRDRAVLIATPEELADLRQAGYDPEVVFESSDKMELYRRAIYGKEMELSSVYWRYDQIIAKAEALEKSHPKLIKRIKIGESQHYRRPIYAFRISNQADTMSDRPRVLFDGAHHSDELMGTQIVTALMDRLVTGYETDEEVTGWLDGLEIYLVPVVNVDGHDMVTSGRDPRWRKNVRDLNGDGVAGVFHEGVNLNRNYNFNWASGGSDVPAEIGYRGAFPFSESETRAMKHLTETVPFTLAISYHSQGEVIFYPWSWSGRAAPDDKVITRVVKSIASQLDKMDGSGTYAVAPGGPSSQSYPWQYGRMGITGMIIETGWGAHVFPPEEVPGVVEANLRGAREVLRQAAGPGLSVKVTDAITGAPLAAEVWLPRVDNESVDRRFSDAQFGRARRLLDPGKYYLVVSREGHGTEVRPEVTVGEDGWTELEIVLVPEAQVRSQRPPVAR
jgi:hypothetical protein